MSDTDRITDHSKARPIFIERTGVDTLAIAQAFGKFHSTQITNGGTIRMDGLPQWAVKELNKHAAEIRAWFGFTNERNAQVPWESYGRR